MKRASTETADTARVCLCCGKKIRLGVRSADRLDKDEALGVPSTSALFKVYESVYLCRNCVTDLFVSQYNMYHDYYVATFYLCKMIDYPYYENYVHPEEEDPEKVLETYFITLRLKQSAKIKQGFIAGQYLSERDMPLHVDAEVVGDGVTEWAEPTKDTKDLYAKWGRNKRYSQDDYDDLEAIYHSIANQNGIITDERTGEIVDKVTEIAVIEAACNLLKSRQARNMGDADDAKKYYELYDKAMGSQLLRGKDLKDKQAGDILVQDIVKFCEQDDFIEPWDRQIKYPHKKDVVDQILLHIMNYVGRLTADIFNKHVMKLDKIPKEYKLDPRNDEFPDEETDFDKQFDKAVNDIADFKARQHISDDEADEDSADLDDDTESDASLFGEED